MREASADGTKRLPLGLGVHAPNGTSDYPSSVSTSRREDAGFPAARCVRGERGATLVEFAIVMPVLFAILLAIVTGGLTYNRKLAVTNGVREAGRYGATFAVGAAASCSSSVPLECWLAQVATVAEQASEGELASPTTSRSICVAYVYPSGATTNDTTRKLNRTSAGDTFSVGSACFIDGRPSAERRVQVTGSRAASIEYVLGSMALTVSSRSVTKFEAG